MDYAKIQQGRGYTSAGYTYYPVVIIGGGVSGIAMACKLKENLGFDQFRVLERQSGIGGTWWINRYPGVACDVPALFYSYSFSQNKNWSTFYPGGLEILEYLQGVAEKHGITDKFQLNTDVSKCRWNKNKAVWELTVRHLLPGMGDLSVADRKRKAEKDGDHAVYIGQQTIHCKVLVSAVGALVEPKAWEDSIPGTERFEGSIFHSARWDYGVDLKDKHVVVIGSGSSAAQFVPALTTSYGARSVTQIMRSPPWVIPRPQPPLGPELWNRWSPWLSNNVPGFTRIIRLAIAILTEFDFRLFGSSEYSQKERNKLAKELTKHLKQTVPLQYQERLSPDYGIGCKRRVFDAAWFSSLHLPNVQLTTLSIQSLQAKTVTLEKGPHSHKSELTSGETVIPADVIVLGNGFEVTRWLHPLEVIGSDDKSLQTVFDQRGGPQMYMGTAMDGFPNFFVLFGPNTVTGHSSVILCAENQTAYCLKFIKPILAGDVSKIEVKKSAEVAYTADIQRALKKSVWNTGGCVSWYKSANGWNSSSYPYTQIWFTFRCMFPTYRDWTISHTPQGLRKRNMRRVINMAVLGIGMLAIAAKFSDKLPQGVLFNWLKCLKNRARLITVSFFRTYLTAFLATQLRGDGNCKYE